MILKGIGGERNMNYKALPLSILMILILVIPCYCAPKHRHRRQLSGLQSRHKSVINPDPVEFSGSLNDISELSPEDRQKLLHNLHNYIVKHAPDLVSSERPKISGVSDVRDNVAVKVGVYSDAAPESSSERDDVNLSAKPFVHAKKKIEMVITPQLAVLKRKKAKAIQNKSTSSLEN